jgi:hypothetical protein
MPVLSDAELRGIAEVVRAIAASRGKSFDAYAMSGTFTRAALRDGTFKARLAEAHWRLVARQAANVPRELLAPLAPLFRDLERDAEAVLSGWKGVIGAPTATSLPRR